MRNKRWAAPLQPKPICLPNHDPTVRIALTLPPRPNHDAALKAMGVDNVDARALGSEMGRVDFDKAMHLDSALPWQSWDAFKGQWAAPLR
jgi:hypothetical protein